MAPDYREGCIRHCSICLHRVRLSKESSSWQVVRRERSSQLRYDVEKKQEMVYALQLLLHRLIVAQLFGEQKHTDAV